MQDLVSIDLAAGCSPKKLKLPKMDATVSFDDSSKEAKAAIKEDKLILQKLIAGATAGLNESKKTLQSEILAFDAKFEPSADAKKNEDAVKAFNSVCANIVSAQTAKAENAVEKAWKDYASKNKKWATLKLKFAAKMAVGTIGLGTAIGVAVASHGTTAIAVLGMAKKAVSMILDIRKLAQDVQKVEDGIESSAKALMDRYTKIDWKGQAAEIAASLGTPFVNGVGKLDEDLKLHAGKIGQLQGNAESLYKHAKDMMKKIEEWEKTADGAAAKKAADAGKKADQMLSRIGDLSKQIDAAGKFQMAYEKLVDVFEEKRKPGNETLAKAVEIYGEASEIKEIVENIKDLVEAAQ